jgi:hypothetical protein
MVTPISIDNTTASPAFTRAAAASRFLRNQLATATALYRFMTFLQPISGLRCSAAMLAAALYFANLRRRLIVPEGAVLLVPHDAAYDGNPSIWGLLEPGREAELVSLILNHIWAPDQPRGGKPQFRTAGNMPATQWAAQVRTIAGPLMFEGYRVFIVDRILPAGRRRREPIAEPNAAAGQKPIKERAVSLSRTHAVVGIWGYPPGIRQSRIRSAYYLARHVPLLEPLVVALRALGIRLFERAGVRRMGQASVHLLRRIRAFAIRVFRAVVRIATAPFRRLRRLWQRVGRGRQAAPSRPVSREHEAQLQEIRLAMAIVGLQKTL